MKARLGRLFSRRRPATPPEPGHEILLSSNCQTGGLMAALRSMHPDLDIGARPLPRIDDDAAADRFRSALQGARIWITTDRLELCEHLPVEVIRIPELNFDAFHPDMRGAINVSTNRPAQRPNASQIAVWAYNNRIAVPDAVRLFNRDAFRSLGYLDRWPHSVAALRTRFADAGIGTEDFERFFLRVKRTGQFMHTFNHPRIEALVELARIVARRLGADCALVDGEVIVPDALTYSLWPLFPEIGEELGLRGNYHWRFATEHTTFDMHGLQAYLTFAYQDYADQGIEPAGLRCLAPTRTWTRSCARR